MNEREEIIREILHEFKVAYTYTGYRYLFDALIMMLNDRFLMSSMRKGVFKVVAEKYDVDYINIEQNIRTIRLAMWRMNRHHPLFKNWDTCPTNGEFLDIVMYEVENRLINVEMAKKRVKREMMLIDKEVEMIMRERKLIKLEQQYESRLTAME